MVKEKFRDTIIPRSVWSRRQLRSSRIAWIFGLLLCVFLYRNWNEPFLDILDIPGTLSVMGTNEPSPRQKARLQQVADLMLDIYETLAEMRYLDPVGIERGPHNIEGLRGLDEELGLDPSIIYLYSILPYINTDEAGKLDFFHGGTFADFRNPDEVRQGRDEFFAEPEGDNFDDEGGPYMRPWFTPLSHLGNHQSVIIYDARKHRIWIIDQEGGDSTDLALKNVPGANTEPPNCNNRIECVASRPATDVLWDINRWFRTFEDFPGSNGDNLDAEWSPWDIDLKALYQKHGWPDHFDGDAFQVDQARAAAAIYAKGLAEGPLRELETFQRWESSVKEEIEKYRNDIRLAKTKEKGWDAKYEQTRKRKAVITEKKEEAQRGVDRFCPNGLCQKKEDLPLWEAEALREEYEWAQDDLNKVTDDPEMARENHIHFRHAEQAFKIHKKAYEDSKAEAELLCPGRTFESATGMKQLGQWRDLVAESQERES